MAVALKGEAEFQHEGETVKLVANVMVLLNAEQETGFGVFDLVARANTNLSVMASLLRHAVAEAGGKAMTLKEAAELILLNDAAPPAVLTAMAGSLPAMKDGDENPPKAAGKRVRGIGMKS